MLVDFNEFRSVNILVSSNKNLAVFPLSKASYPVFDVKGKAINDAYFAAFPPFLLDYPYSREALAETIQKGIEAWDKYECFKDGQGNKITYEEVYYGVKGFKKAVKGIRYISLGWNIIDGKYIDLSLPLKKGYAYLIMDRYSLSNDADWDDFAEAVLKYVNSDLDVFPPFKTFKNKLNL